MKPTQSHYNIAQRIEDRRTGDRVADIDAIAQALAEAERGGERKGIREGKRQAAELADAYAKELRKVFANDCARAVQGVRDDILSTIPDEAE